MITLRRPLFLVSEVLNSFLAVTAVLGGIAIVAGINVPSVDQLEASIFKGATIPGIALFLIVGGSALLATFLLIRKSNFALLFSTLAGITIMCFEFVEVLIIGSPVGYALTLQVFYFGLGIVLVGMAVGIWFIDLLTTSN